MTNTKNQIKWEFGWLTKYPSVLYKTWKMKYKNRALSTPERYAQHQIDFFSLESLRIDSDKFSSLRSKIAHYAKNNDDSVDNALDIACGMGFQAKALLDIGIPNVVGIDLVPSRIIQAKKLFGKTNIDFRVMDATCIEYPDNYFACTTISAALHDMPKEVCKKVLAEAARVTRKRIVIMEPRNFKNKISRFIYGTIAEILDESLNIKEYVSTDIENEIRHNNLQIIKSENVWYRILCVKICEKQCPSVKIVNKSLKSAESHSYIES